jgi:hypothetical protein
MKRFAVRMDRNEACGPGLETDRSMLEAYMRRFAISVAAAGVLAGAPVLAQSVGEKTGINSALEISPTTADFVKEAATSDMFEIEAAKVAETKGNAEEKSSLSKWSRITPRPVRISRPGWQWRCEGRHPDLA